LGELGAIAIGAIVASIACVLTTRAYRQRRWHRLIWGFKIPANERPKIVLETIEGEETGLYRRPTAGLGAVEAVTHLSTALNASRSGLTRRSTRALAHPIALSFSSEALADEWCSTADIVVVGGPKSNDITRQVLASFGCQPPPGSEIPDKDLLQLTEALRMTVGDGEGGLGVATQGNYLYWFGEKVAGHVTYNDDDASGRATYHGYDYGVVLRLPSPTNPAHRLVVIFGSQTFGVAAAARWLANLRRRQAGPKEQKSRESMAKQKNIAVLIRAGVVHGQLSEPEVVETVPLPDHLVPRDW
jgi:hypothetical protein